MTNKTPVTTRPVYKAKQNKERHQTAKTDSRRRRPTQTTQ